MSQSVPASSPNKFSQLKRPQQSTSSTNSAQSPDQSSKKPRLNGNGEPVKDIGKGGRWMVEKLEELERLYKAVVKSATVILQYQAFALRLGKQERTLPVHLQKRVKIAWGSYEASRRQVQAYMNESAQHASTPSSRPFAIPIPLPPTNASLSIPQPANMPLASPIPLAEATLQSFNQTSLPASQPPSAIIDQSPVTLPDINGNGNGNGNGQPFSFDMLQGQAQGQVQGETNGMFDLSMEMGDLAAMLKQGSQNFSLNMDGIMNGAQQPQAQSQVQPQIPGLTMPAQPQPPQPQQTVISDPVINSSLANAETEQLLAQLGAMPDSSENQQSQPPLMQSTGNVDEDDINALLASLGDVNEQDFSNFDFSTDLDMGNMGDMGDMGDMSNLAGLFNTTTAVGTDTNIDEKALLAIGDGTFAGGEGKAEPGLPGFPPSTDGQGQVPIDLTSEEVVPAPQPPTQSQPQAPSQPLTTTHSQIPTQTEAEAKPPPQLEPEASQQNQIQAEVRPNPAVPNGPSEPKKEEEPQQPQQQQEQEQEQQTYQVEGNEFSGIDMDDFNFGDGDDGQEGMEMSGVEFDRLLGAFNN